MKPATTGRIGILGGTFDPPHMAHLAMAKTARDRIPLDRVLLMPAPSPPHKQSTEITPYHLRVEMVRLAVEGQDRIEVSLIEEFRLGPSYTVELLEHFVREHDDDVYLILGADSVVELATWKNPTRILELCTLVVFPRTGWSSVIPVDGDAAVVLFEEPVIDVSSSEVRNLLRVGSPVKEFVPARVLEFILDNSLYS